MILIGQGVGVAAVEAARKHIHVFSVDSEWVVDIAVAAFLVLKEQRCVVESLELQKPM